MPEKRALLVVTSDNTQFYDDGKKTGLYWAEAIHPYNVYTKAGYDVDVVSETGSVFLDEHSIADDAMDEESKAAWNDASNPHEEGDRGRCAEAIGGGPLQVRHLLRLGRPRRGV